MEKKASIVDGRGLSCPIPVVMTRNEAKSGASAIDVLVDNVCAVENVTRFAKNNGYAVDMEQAAGDEFTLKLRK